MLGQLVALPSFIVGVMSSCFWVFWAFVGERITPHDPLRQTPELVVAPSSEHWFGTDQLGRDVFSRVLAGASDTLIDRAARDAARDRRRHDPRPDHRLLRGIVDDTISRVIDAVLALPLIVIAVTASSRSAAVEPDPDHRDRRRLHADRRAHRARDRARRARPRLRPGGAATRGARALHHVHGDPPERHGPDRGRDDGAPRLCDLRRRALTFLGFGVQPPSPDWSLQIADNYTLLNAARTGGRCCSRRSRSPPWSSAST